MVTLTLTGDREDLLMSEAKHLSDTVLSKLSGDYGKYPFVVFGPFEAQIYKLNEKYRMRMVLKCKLNPETRKFFHELLCEFSTVRDVTLAIDQNPLT